MKKHLAAGAIATVITLLLAVGAAVAVEGGKSDVPPPKADPALSQSSDSDSSESTESTESSESDSESSDQSSGEHPENHGKYVSEAANSCPDGPDHGPCVAAVAKSDQGKPSKP